MKSRINPFLRFSSLLTAASIAFAASAHAADFTWDGGTGNWNATNWNGATAAGPTTAGNTATINSGNVTVNVGGTGSLDSITLGSGAQMNVYNGDGGIYAYTTFANLILQGGTLNGGSATYHTYGTSQIGNLTVSGSAASTITSGSWFNFVPSTTFTVADVTTGADLLINSRMYAPPLDGNDNDWGTAALTKEGLGTMRLTLGTYNVNVTVNAGTLEFVGEAEAGAGGGYGFVRNGSITVNSGATLSLTGSGTGFGWRSDNPSSVNIVGGTITSGANHVFDIGGGVNMTGGLLDSTTGSFQWKGTPLNSLASADTATIAGGLSLRTDFGSFNQTINVADGAAATDLLISANITQPNVNIGSITKIGDGTLELSGANSYKGSTTVNGGTLVLSGSSLLSPSINVNATGTLTLSSPILDDGASVAIASGASMALNFSGTDTVGSLDIDGSGPLPAGLYNASHGTYGSYFSGTGSLEILAQSGTWTSLADGNWSDSANWAGNIIAVGTDNTATFNAATGATVTVDGNRLIGNLAFDVSDYTLAGANTLTLDSASSTPTISVTTGRSATISAGLAGTDGMEKTGNGTLVLSGVKTYTGGTTVTAGTLELSSATGDFSAVNGSLTVASGATLKLSGTDFTGLGRLGSTVTTLDVNGGTVDSSIESWVSGATVNLTGATMSVSGSGRYQIISSTINSLASATSSTISGSLLIRKDYLSSDLSIVVDDGDAADDLLISGSIQQVLTAGVTKLGAGKLVLSGTNTYTGNTVVNDGELEVTSTLRFRPASNGSTNAVLSATGDGSLSFTGTVDLDLTAAVAADGNVWNLFNLGSFTVEPDLSSVAAVTSTLGSFSEVSAGTWELAVSGAKWVFTEADGNLAYVNDAPPATPYQTWGSTYGLDTGSESGDLDNDGLSNFQEFAFGLIPNDGSSVNPITAQLDKTSGQFSYQRLNGSGLTYTIWTSTDLVNWTEDTTAGQAVTTGSPNDSVQVTLSGAPLTASKLFVRVKAE